MKRVKEQASKLSKNHLVAKQMQNNLTSEAEPNIMHGLCINPGHPAPMSRKQLLATIALHLTLPK